MTRLTALNPDETSGKTKDLFNVFANALGVVPNMMRTMGNSPAILEGYMGLSGALGKGTLGSKIGELIALTVAESNGCNYCLSAHTYLGDKLAKLDTEAMELARRGTSKDPKINAILKFAQVLVTKKGNVKDGDVAAIKAAGVTEGEVGEIIGHVALNILTNYFNITAATEIDFPLVESLQPAVV
ncbi:MAG TPA: carboxymuconolactone decarboxylase family protein [Ohtaekwangia sp.]|uniref:carboxymuconolactone decarboxylase family protein n=1 Tax=Ohtaekwangia sp. TaxID=2066019 RepID=UPI002F921212